MDVISCVEASAEGAVAVEVTSLDVTRLVASDVMVESIAEETDETMEEVTSSSVEEGIVVCAELEMLDVVTAVAAVSVENELMALACGRVC